MHIETDCFVVFDYVMRDQEGVTVDEGNGDDAMAYVHGRGSIPTGLEEALTGRAVGDTFTVEVPPARGFGEKGEPRIVRVSPKGMPKDLAPGDELRGEDDEGNAETFWVVDVRDDAVVLTPEHPLAGVHLVFDVVIRDVRRATEDEIAHAEKLALH